MIEAGATDVSGPGGPIEVLVTGAGAPVTLFLHGLTGSIVQTRPFGSGVAGTRVFAHLSGHGATAVPPRPDKAFAELGRARFADQTCALLTATGARAALGVSLGAAALLAAVASPGATGPVPRLDRLVLCLPPAIGGPSDAVRQRLAAMADALDAGDAPALARLLRDHQPEAVRRSPAVTVWARRHATDLLANCGAGLAAVLRSLPASGSEPRPSEVAAAFAGHPLTALIVAQEGNDVHPVAAARVWADALAARLEVLPPGGVPWRAREALREIIAGHLNARAAVTADAEIAPDGTPRRTRSAQS